MQSTQLDALSRITALAAFVQVPVPEFNVIRNRFAESYRNLGWVFLKVRRNPFYHHVAELLNIPSGRADSGIGIKLKFNSEQSVMTYKPA